MPVRDPWQPQPAPVRFPLHLPPQDQSMLSPSMGASPLAGEPGEPGSYQSPFPVQGLSVTGSAMSPMQAGPSYSPAASVAPSGSQARTGQMSKLDAFMNALGAAGAGFAGRGVSPGPLIEMEMQRRKFESDQAAQQAQILQHGVMTLHALQPLLMNNPAAVPDIVQRVLMPIFKAGGTGSQAADQGAADARLQQMLTDTLQGKGGISKEELAQGFPYASASAQKMAQNLNLAGHPEQAVGLLRTENEAGRKEATNHLLSGITRARTQNPEQSVADIIKAIPESLQQEAHQLLMDADEKRLEQAGISSKDLNVVFEQAKAKEAGTVAGGGGPGIRTLGMTATNASYIQQDPRWASLNPQGLPFIQAWKQLPPETQTSLLKTANDLENANVTQQRMMTGAGVETVKRGFPVLPEERGKHIIISELLKGSLVQPPAGITEQELATGKDIASITPQQADKFAMLAPTKQIIDTAKTMSDRLITAKTPQEAFTQGIKLWAGAKTGSIPEAAAYVDAMEGYVTNLSRTLGGEKGVLTDKDRTVMKKAAVASLFDTQQAKDLKQAILFDIYKAHNLALVNEITKTKGPSLRSQLDVKLAELDKLNRQTFARGVPAGKQAVYNEQTGAIGYIDKGNTPTKGWKLLNE